MRQADVATLFDHLYWLRDRLVAAADHPDVPLVDDAPVTTRDLRATLVHELDVEWSWRDRLRSADPTDFSPDDEELNPADFPTLAAIRERWLDDEAEMRGWIAGLTDADLDGPCRAEKKGSHPLWFHLQHLSTHGMQQLSEAAVLLTRAGHSPGEIDFLEYVEGTEKARPASTQGSTGVRVPSSHPGRPPRGRP
jgi:uncharacterized damage-inducible protein DinB